MTVFAKRVQMLRERRRKSRKVLSELCGLSSDAIRRYERDEVDYKKIELGTAVAIAEELDVSIDYLVGRTETPEINKRDDPRR